MVKCKEVLVLSLCLLMAAPSFIRAEEVSSSDQASKPPKPQPLLNPYQQDLSKVEVVADQLEYDRKANKIIAKSNAVITFEDTKITADYAEVFSDSREAIARGHVMIFDGEELRGWGDEAYFNFANKTGSFPHGTSFSTPWFVTGREINQIKEGVIVIHDARVTTCNFEDPHYEIRSSKATVYRGDKMNAWNVRIYALDKPIFWLPFLHVPLRQNNLPFTISVGRNDEHGYYIETSKGFSISRHLQGRVFLDWRSKRGFGGGASLDYDYGALARGNIIGYRTQDDEAPTVTRDTDNPFEIRESRDRGRFTWRHRADIDPYSFLVLRYHRVADEWFMQDFFEKEHRSDIEQHSFVTVTKNTERWGSMIHLQKQMNDFEALVERLPEIRFDWKNQKFLIPGLYYENQNSYANLIKRYGRWPMRAHVNRFDSFHQWFAPQRFGDIKWTPFVNMRGTYYSRERFGPEDRFRTALGYGVDVRTQFYKTYNHTSNFAGIEINNLRHIFEPVFRVNAIHPSTVSDETLEHFDNVDLVDDQDVFTFGMENRIQTKRMINGQLQRVDIVSFNTFLNYELNPDDISSKSSFKILSTELVLRPYQWLQFETRSEFDVERGQFRTFNQDMILFRDRMRFLIGHRYVKDERFSNQFGDIDASHQFVFEANYKINRLWEIHGHVRWDADEQELEEWQIGATRDLHDFIFDFGYNVRNSSIRSNNSELYFNFTMKNFPALALRSGAGRATFAQPRIGETVAGANQYGVDAGTTIFE